MCGICGYIGNNKAYDFIYEGILNLLNRGYDSVGLSTIETENNYSFFLTHKHASDDTESAEKKILKYKQEHNGTVGIGHCRWRTNGEKTDTNSHPHNDKYNIFSIVHNGIIDNYKKIKGFLINNNYEFYSETDTEVLANLISYYYLNDPEIENLNKKVITSIKSALKEVNGTYALAILCKATPNVIFTVKKGSPLLIGVSKKMDFAMVASEQYGFNSNIDKYLCLDDDDIVVVERNSEENRIILYSDTSYQINKLNYSKTYNTHEPFPNWTIKEIHEQPETSLIAIVHGNRIVDEETVRFVELEKHKKELYTITNLVIVACGSSYNAGLIGINYFKDLCSFNNVQIFDGAFFTENDIPKTGKTALLFISQSGETRDLYDGIQIGKTLKLTMLGIINVQNSMISRETDYCVYLKCGREVGVASTKAITSQIIILAFMAIWFSQCLPDIKPKIKQYIEDIKKLPNQIREILKSQSEIDGIISLFENKSKSFVICQNPGIAYEGALKMKEMSYIMTEGMLGSSLKHGPFSILEDDFPVIAINNEDQDGSMKNYNKMKNIIEEIKSRNANIITITDNKTDLLQDSESNCREKIIKIPENKTFSPVLSIVALQLLSYKLSISRNKNIDFPRHLSKTVTV